MPSNLSAQLYLGDISICPEGQGDCGSCVRTTDFSLVEAVSNYTINYEESISDYTFSDSDIFYDLNIYSSAIISIFNNNDVKLLLHMDGTNGSTTFTDSSPSPLTATISGNVQISTADSEFGGASAYFDGSGDFISYTSGNGGSIFDVSNDDFTMEAFIKLNNITGTKTIFSKRATTGTFGSFVFWINGSTLNLSATNNGTSWGVDINSGTTTLSSGVWYHVALSKDIGGFNLFIDGRKVATATTNNFTIPTNSSNAVIGAGSSAGSQEFAGYIDEFRFIRQIALYGPNNFPVPTGAF